MNKDINNYQDSDYIFVRKIAVPKNNDGAKECTFRSMEWTDENTELYYIEEEIFDLMWETGMYEKLSSIEGVMFDDYESDCIPDECLPKCIERQLLSWKKRTVKTERLYLITCRCRAKMHSRIIKKPV